MRKRWKTAAWGGDGGEGTGGGVPLPPHFEQVSVSLGPVQPALLNSRWAWVLLTTQSGPFPWAWNLTSATRVKWVTQREICPVLKANEQFRDVSRMSPAVLGALGSGL